jgi:hypothetical protein
MKKRKLQCGPLITTLDQLEKCEWVIIHNKPYNRGWVVSWPLRVAAMYVKSGVAYEGVRLTNGQYYHNYAKAKIKSRFADELYRVSPCRNGEACPLAEECKEHHCWKSFQAWKEAPVA